MTISYSLPTWNTTFSSVYSPSQNGTYSDLHVDQECQLYMPNPKRPVQAWIDEFNREEGELSYATGPIYSLLLVPKETSDLDKLDPYKFSFAWKAYVIVSDLKLGDKAYAVDYIESRWDKFPNHHYALLLRRIRDTEIPST